jgi:hypothetical protein
MIKAQQITFTSISASVVVTLQLKKLTNKYPEASLTLERMQSVRKVLYEVRWRWSIGIG